MAKKRKVRLSSRLYNFCLFSVFVSSFWPRLRNVLRPQNLILYTIQSTDPNSLHQVRFRFQLRLQLSRSAVV